MTSELSSSNAILSSLMRDAAPDPRPLAQAIGSVAAASARGTRTSAEEAAVEFEAYLLRTLIGEMRKTVGEGGLFGESHTRQYDAMLDDALSRRAAEARSFGLADQMLAQWERGT